MQRPLNRPHASLAMLLLLGACAHSENYRWSEESDPKFPSTVAAPKDSHFGSWSDPSVSVYSFPTPATVTADAGLRDLSDRGQAALIAALTAAKANPDDIRDALAKPIKAKTAPTEVPVTVEGLYKRTLVANVTKGWSAKPGDRLVWTWVYVRPTNFTFEGYTVIATDNELLNVEQVTNATTGSVTAQVGQTSSDTSGSTTSGSPITSTLSKVLGSSAGVSGTLSNTYTTTAQINQQYVKLGADIIPDELRIYRESERNLDVAGNTLIALSVRLDPSLLDDAAFVQTLRVTALSVLNKNAFVTPAKAIFEVALNKAPPKCRLKADVTLYYQFRQTRDGRSYVEGQQDAEYTSRQSDTRDVTIVPADEITKLSWRIYSNTNPVELFALDLFDHSLPLDFTSFEQASAFAAWLNHRGKAFFSSPTPSVGKTGIRLASGVGVRSWFPIKPGQFVARPYQEDKDSLAAKCAKIDASFAANRKANTAGRP